MFDKDFVKECVSKAASKVNFDSVSNLSKSDFMELLSDSITEVLKSDEFMHHVSAEMARLSVRHNRGRL